MVADSSRYDVNTVTFYPLFNCMAYCVFVCVELLKKVETSFLLISCPLQCGRCVKIWQQDKKKMEGLTLIFSRKPIKENGNECAFLSTTVMHIVEVGSSRQTAGAANSPAVCL